MEIPQKIRVSKKFTFDMAHALHGYDGPCKNIHGHTYHLSVSLLGSPITDDNDSKLGMVLDFKVLKALIKPIILDAFDHALVIYEKAPYAQSGILTREFEKVILLPYQPTCENLLLHFVNLIKPRVPQGLHLISMKLEETPTSYAEWLADDNK